MTNPERRTAKTMPSAKQKPEGPRAKIRLQVFLSKSGVCSRREAMEIIFAGRVTVNGAACSEPSTPVDPSKDNVSLDGQPLSLKTYQYILLNKPAGFVTTKADSHADRIVTGLLPPEYSHLFPVGRLDKDTEGLLLMTNDGDLAFKLTHPKFNVDKTYFVRMKGELSMVDQVRLERGVKVEGEMTAPAKIRDVKTAGGKTELFMTIHEGRKRQVRLMFAALRHNVVYLQRICQGPIALGDLKTGSWRFLSTDEIQTLKKI